MTGPRRVALVTGASRGIGKATAIDLAAAGFDVVVTARTAVDGTARLPGHPEVAVPGGLDTTVQAIEAHGVTGVGIVMDLLDHRSLVAAVDQTVARFGRVDVLVNNAIYQGPGTLAPFVDLTDAELSAMFTGNVFAQLTLIRRVLPGMLERGAGTIVNLISGAGLLDPPARVGEGGWSLGYAMTKAAFGRVAPLLHVEHATDGLRVFSVNPGLVVTERMEAAGRAAQYREHFSPGTPAVIGRAIRWLVTDPDSSELCGRVVDAQREVADRRLLDRWPPS